MSFVSYAQNFEDVMLWRALKHVPNGVYVDVGAQHPVVDSVSKAFYERGWRGIHIEPVPAYAELLRKDRPDETVLQVALADAEGMLELNVIPDTGLSTAVEAYAQRHQIERGYDSQRVQVPVLTLKAATKSLVGKDVHWLKIDVEGFEEKVLKGWDSQTLRPWVMVVEATIPNLPEVDYLNWDPILTAADYQFVYFDGLNRFYVAKEHAELAEAFFCPPNVFDEVELSGLASWGLCRGLIASHQASEKELAAQAQWLQNEWDAARQRIEELSKNARRLEIELAVEQQKAESRKSNTQWLQNEWDAAKQRVEELSKSTGRLEAELAAEQTKAINIALELTAVNEHNTQLQAHAQWLQNELNASSAKVHELNNSTHHWWAAANQPNKELQIIYASKFWRLTWPLRKIMQAAKWTLDLPSRTVRWALRLPKRIARPLAINRTSTTSHSSETGTNPQNSGAAVYPPNMPEESINNLSLRAARIYTDLKKAMEARKN